jgi:hypothetical protein
MNVISYGVINHQDVINYMYYGFIEKIIWIPIGYIKFVKDTNSVVSKFLNSYHTGEACEM